MQCEVWKRPLKVKLTLFHWSWISRYNLAKRSHNVIISSLHAANHWWFLRITGNTYKYVTPPLLWGTLLYIRCHDKGGTFLSKSYNSLWKFYLWLRIIIPSHMWKYLTGNSSVIRPASITETLKNFFFCIRYLKKGTILEFKRHIWNPYITTF